MIQQATLETITTTVITAITKMKWLLSLIFGLLLITQFTACESEDSKTSSSEYVEKQLVVTGVSSTVIEGEDGDIYQYSGANWRVIVTSATKIYVQRESCSGLNTGSPQDVHIGSTIFFKFNPEEANYLGSPNVARATKIEAYKPDCVESGGVINIQVLTNTVTQTVTTTSTVITTNILR